MIFLMKQLAKNNKTVVYQIFIQTGHGKGPMDVLGACIKQTIKGTITYNPNGRSNTGELMQYMADLSNICILT